MSEKRVLVIDDAPDIRIYVKTLLETWGYEASVVQDGAEGLEKIRETAIRIIVCDWEMPGMSGPDVCRAVRSSKLGRYIYIILLTGRSQESSLVEGLNAGADDFIEKPVNPQVLRARLRVADRILRLEQSLAKRNQELKISRNKLRLAYNEIQEDLKAAAQIQLSTLPKSDQGLYPLRANWLYLPAFVISGDSFNFFKLSPRKIGFYHLDVSGHGVPAALLSTSLSRNMLPGGRQYKVDQRGFLDPAMVLSDLNQELSDPQGEVLQFATMAYGTLDNESGEGEIAVAGHPQPIILRQDGNIEYLDLGGLPVGMFPESSYESQKFYLRQGESLVLYSDGITECSNEAGEMFGIKELETVAVSSSMQSFPDALCSRLMEWRGSDRFDDDISMFALSRPKH
ncbi:MAG: PP2C family protein-serine/threonine phosphatase [Rhodothermales bacterium]